MTDLNALADKCERRAKFDTAVDPYGLLREAAQALRAAASSQAGVETAPPSQEPVAWRRRRKGIAGTGGWIMCPECPSRDKEFDLEPLYNTPPAQPAPAQQAVDVEAVAKLISPDAFDPKPDPDEPEFWRKAARVLALKKARAVLALINGGRDAG